MLAVASPDWVWMRLSLGWMDQVRRLNQERVTNLERMSAQAASEESDVRTGRLGFQSDNQHRYPKRSLLLLEEQESATDS